MFKLGPTSLQRLNTVDPRLQRTVKHAISICPQDFSVHEGARSIATQREYFRTGASQTMDSRHLVQSDGWAKATDLVPWAGGMLRWEWPLIWPIVESMRIAAIKTGTPIRWGGGWFLLNDKGSLAAVKRAMDAYVAARRAARKKAFMDGPHFEIPVGH